MVLPPLAFIEGNKGWDPYVLPKINDEPTSMLRLSKRSQRCSLVKGKRNESFPLKRLPYSFEPTYIGGELYFTRASGSRASCLCLNMLSIGCDFRAGLVNSSKKT